MHNFKRLYTIAIAILDQKYGIFATTEKPDLQASRSRYAPSTVARECSIVADSGESIDLVELALSIKALIDADLAEQSLTPEGIEAGVSRLASHLYITSDTPSYCHADARKDAQCQYDPFANAVRLLQGNGYKVEQKQKI